MMHINSAKVRKKQVEDCQENEHLLSLFSSSEKKFIDDFKKCVGTPKMKAFHFYVLTKLRDAVLANETNIFSRLLSVVNCVGNLDPKIRTYSYESENPLNDSNLVILACKYNRPEILKCLLCCDVNVLNILSTGEPELIDSEKRNAFYYAIRSGNVELLDTLINEWPNKYFASNLEKLEDILAKAYAELKLKNVLLSDEIEIFVESKLFDLRFYSSSSSQVKCSQNNLNNVKDRIKLITENVDFLKTNYPDKQKVDDKFLFVAKSVAQNIFTLKRQLKSTYDKLPWEEIEFCLICFVSSHIKQKEINLFYKSTLNKLKILTYLENFVKKLNGNLMNCSVNTFLPNERREQIVAEIMKKSPEFKEMYDDYQKLRDLSSLEKICNYLKLGLSANPLEQEGQLVIIRVLQVIGEYLKNTLESPKLSSSASESLLSALSSGTKRILNDIRNALSHSHSLSKRMELEDNASLPFFTGLQNDMKKIDSLVTDIQRRLKMKHILALLENITKVESFDEIELFSEVFNNTASIKKDLENIEFNEHERLEKLMKKFDDIVTDKNDYEKKLFQDINGIIDQTRSQSKDFKCNYVTGMMQLHFTVVQLTSGRSDKKFKDNLKLFNSIVLKCMTPEIEPHKIKKVVELSTEIFNSVSLRAEGKILDELYSLHHAIFWMAEFVKDLKWIEKFREKLTAKLPSPIQKQDHTNGIPENKYEDKLRLKQHELGSILSSEGFCCPAPKHLAPYKQNKELQSIVEMLVLDIMTILEISKTYLEKNYSFLDDDFPLLTGKCLRNHLVHDNALIDLLHLDPAAAVFLNAKKLIDTSKVQKNNKKISKPVENCGIRDKFNRELLIINNQDFMFKALAEGDLSELENCLQNGADVHARSINLQTSAHFASMASNLDVVKYIYGLGVNFNVQDIGDRTPLHIASEIGTKSVVEFFIGEVGLPVDCIDNSKKTPLHFAAKNGHVDVVKILLKSKADNLAEDLCQCIPLHYAIRHNHLDVTKILIQEVGDFDINEVIGGHVPLYEAADSGNLALIDYLLQIKANPDGKSHAQRVALHEAAQNGYVEVVDMLIKKGANIDAQDKEGFTALHHAAEKGHEEVVRLLLQHEARDDICHRILGTTALFLAARRGHTKIISDLLKNGADPNLPSTPSLSPLHAAADNGHFEIVADLLKHGAYTRAEYKDGSTALHLAAKNGYKNISDLLIHYHAEVDAKTFDGTTPLHLAALGRHKEVVDVLIAKNANVDAKNTEGIRPLHLAADEGSVEVINTLMQSNAKTEVENRYGLTPLCFAAKNGHTDAVISLIKNNAKVNIESKVGFNPLNGAIIGGHYNIVETLLKNNARINFTSKDDKTPPPRFTPLYLAVQSGRKDIVELLRANGADISTNSNNSMLLLSAIKLNKKEIVEMLLKNSADVDEGDGKAIFQAIFEGFKDIVEILLKYKARTDFKYTNNSTLLHAAARRGNTKIMSALLNKGMDPDVKADNDVTPLYIACKEGHDDIVEVLIARNANVKITCDGETPLHVAARFGRDRVVEVLVNYDAEIDAKNKSKRTPLEEAVASDHLEVVKVFLQHKSEIINEPYNDGWTLLHLASQQNNIEMVKYLVNAGSDINEPIVGGLKPVHIAAKEGVTDVVEFYLGKGISIDDDDSDERTILHYAAMNSCSDVVKYLLANGATVNSKDTNGSTPLHAAAKFGSEATVKVLLEYGAFYNSVNKSNEKPSHTSDDSSIINLLESIEKLFDAVKHQSPVEAQNLLKEGVFVNAKNADSRTPLHFAAWKGNIDVMNILLENGANPNSVCKEGLTPLHYAAKFSHLQAVLALLGSGAIYNAVSGSGKTPLDLSSNRNVGGLLKQVNELFEKVQNGNIRVIHDLRKINGTERKTAIFNAFNKKSQSLVVAAMDCKFPKIEQLKQVIVGDATDDIARASALSQQGNYQVASNILNDLLNKRKKILGSDNPDTLDIKVHLAKILIQEEKFTDAWNILENVCTKQSKILGMGHRDTLNTKSAMAEVLQKQEKNNESLGIYKEVYAKQKEMLGSNHIETLDTQIQMARVLRKLAKYGEALKLFQIAYEKLKSTCGETDLLTITVQNNIGLVLTSQTKYEEAMEIFTNVLEKMRRVLGSNHPGTAQTLFNIATLLSQQKKFGDALTTYREAFNIQKNCLGSQHLETLKTEFSMASVLSKNKSLEGSKIYRDIVDPVKSALGIDLSIKLTRNMEMSMLAHKLMRDLNVNI